MRYREVLTRQAARGSLCPKNIRRADDIWRQYRSGSPPRRDARQDQGTARSPSLDSHPKPVGLGGCSTSCGYAAGPPADAEMRSNSRLRHEGFGDADHVSLLARTVGLCPAYGRGSSGSGNPVVPVCAAFSAGTRRVKMQGPKDETVGLAVAGASRGELGQAARRALAEAEE